MSVSLVILSVEKDLHSAYLLVIAAVFFSLPTHAKTESCPDSEAPPQIQFSLGKNKDVFVCGREFEAPSRRKDTLALKEFKVFRRDKDKIETVFDAHPYRIYILENRAKKKSIVIDEVLKVGDQHLAAYQQTVTCTSQTCKVSEQKCVFKPPKPLYPDAMKELGKSLEDKSYDNIEEQIERVYAHALTGDKPALEFFEKTYPELTDSSAGELITSHRDWLDRLRSTKCLK